MNGFPLRLRRILDPGSGRALLLTFTHGMRAGGLAGIEGLPRSLIELAPSVTAAVAHAGVLPSVFRERPGLECGAVVDLFGGTWLAPGAEYHHPVSSLEHAVRVGADAVLATLSLGGRQESTHLRLCGQIARDCTHWGLPLILHVDTLERGLGEHYSPTLIGRGARTAYELGADLVVLNLCNPEEHFAKALEGIDIPVLIGGGPRMHTDAALLDSVGKAVKSSDRVRGVCLPATLFWDRGPTPALSALAKRLFQT